MFKLVYERLKKEEGRITSTIINLGYVDQVLMGQFYHEWKDTEYVLGM